MTVPHNFFFILGEPASGLLLTAVNIDRVVALKYPLVSSHLIVGLDTEFAVLLQSDSAPCGSHYGTVLSHRCRSWRHRLHDFVLRACGNFLTL